MEPPRYTTVIGTSRTPRADAWSSTRSRSRSGPPKKVPPVCTSKSKVATSSKRDSIVTCAPSVGAIVIACNIPVTDASGLIMKMLSAAVRRAASMKLRDATSIVLREWTTPFGRDVVPEVKMITEGSSGSRGDGGPPVTGGASPTTSIGSQRGRGSRLRGPNPGRGTATPVRARGSARSWPRCRSPARSRRWWARPSRGRRAAASRGWRPPTRRRCRRARTPRRPRATPCARSAATAPSTAASSSA